MNPNSFCFIMCINDDQAAEEALHYISCLKIPEGMTVDNITVKEAGSMTEGYNAAMNSSDAKYKIYMHQDVLILNENFLFDILELFKDEKTGMVGMVGAPVLPENAIMWTAPRVGSIYSTHYFQSTKTVFDKGRPGDAYEVDVIDGLLMTTQYDLPWREDIITGWDFYDVSQSLEFKKAGYRVVVPHQDQPWCLHDDGYLNLKNYFKYREVVLKEYGGRDR